MRGSRRAALATFGYLTRPPVECSSYILAISPENLSRLRITVWDALSWLAAGTTKMKIVQAYPKLERDYFVSSMTTPSEQASESPVKLLFNGNPSRKLTASGSIRPNSWVDNLIDPGRFVTQRG